MTLTAQLERSLRDVFAPVDTREVWQWAEDEIVLTRRQTETPGPYSTLLTPYIREPLNCFADPRVSDVTLCFGTQTAKSTALLIGMAWRMVNNPTPTLWVAPNENFVRSFSENRWQPMVDDCRKLAALKPDNHHRYKTLEQQFRDCTVNFVGSNSPANLASRPIGLLIMDETDKFAEPSSKEAGAVALAENRTKSFTNALRVKTSTPTTQEGEIWQAFLQGDQRYYFVPCPHCSHMQRLIWPRVKWAEEARLPDGKNWDMEVVKATAHYICEACEGHINNGHKTKMLREGEWRATNPNAPANKRSYHLNSLYAPWRSCNFGELAAQFLTAKSGLLGLQDFINGALAEPWEESMTEDDRPIALGEYRLREPHADGEVRMMGVDVQLDHYWFVCRAFRQDGASRLVDEGRLQLWEDVEAKVAELGVDVMRSVGPVRCRLVVVDYGFRAQEIYDRCMANRYVPARGEERAHYPIKLGEVIRRAPSIVRPFRKGWIHMLWSSQLTQDILEWLRSGQGPEWTVAGDVSESYKRQLNAHKKTIRRNHLTGRETAIWQRIGKRDDHLLDCECMITALADFGGVFKTQQKPEAPAA